MLPVPIVSERTGLADQSVDDMPKVNEFLLAADQSGCLETSLTRVPEFDLVGVNSDRHAMTNKAAWDRIPILFDSDDRVAAHHAIDFRVGRKRLGWQRGEHSLLFLK